MNIRALIQESVRQAILEFDYDSPIYKANKLFMHDNLAAIKHLLTVEAPKELIDQAGLPTILDFLAVEDGTNFHISVGNVAPGTVDFSKQPEPKRDDESEIQYLLRINKIPFTEQQINDRVFAYFFRRLIYNIPSDKPFATVQDAENYIKMYIQKFLHGYLIPMAAMAEKHAARAAKKNG